MILWPCALSFLLPLLGDGSRPEFAKANLSLLLLDPRGSEWKKEAALRESIKRITRWNALSFGDNVTALYGINQFSHLFPEEFKAIYLQSRPSKVPRYVPQVTLQGTDSPLPAKFDWRDKNVVTEVRNQRECGACWAFSVVSGIESAYAIKGNVLEELSVQQVIDCSFNNYGCNGGSTVSALNWLNQTRVKLVRDSEYVFKAHTGLCHYFKRSDFGISITHYVAYDLRTVTDDEAEWFIYAGKYVGNTVFQINRQEDEMMKMLIKWGPLAVIVDALSWQDYLGGIIQHHCSSGEPNHAVVVTGFDRTGSIPYWIVRNSWGHSWGINGYARVKMGSNICGIADSVSAVFV